MSDSSCQIGDRIGPFVLEQRLGAEGTVFHAIHVEERRSAAVKVLPAMAERDERAVADFARELLFLPTLQHPNVVPCYGGGVHGNTPYVAMELVRGDSLDVRLSRAGPLPWQTAATIAKGVCEGLAYADHRNVAHLRLTPAKIMLAQSGWVKVLDFRRPRGKIGVRDPAAERTVESLTYLAPEQIVGKPPASHKSDLYALGCILLEMLIGRPPFLADTPDGLAQAHLTADPPRITSEVIDCPVWLDALVAQMLEKDPEKRPHFASAVAVALEEACERAASGASTAQHALGVGPSAIRTRPADPEARQLFATKKKPPPPKPFYEKLWFLLTCAALLVAVITWAVWPLSEKELFDRGAAMMQSDDPDQWRVARREYLDPLLASYPKGEYAEKAQGLIDRIDMADAEERIKRHLWLGREPTSVGERLYVRAKKYEDFGDAATAMRKYNEVIRALRGDARNRPFLKLAERQRRKIKSRQVPPRSPAEFLDRKILEGEQLAAAGKEMDARKLWHRMIDLYVGQPDVKEQVKRAQKRVLGVEDDE